MGVSLAVDDYGTGYSSLSYLRRMEVDELKIDKSFVMQMGLDDNSAIIVRSTIELGHSLGLTVTAEGVEDRATYETLQRLGCDRIQGFFHSRPLAAPAMEAWLNEQRLGADERLVEQLGRHRMIIPVLGLLAVLSPMLAGGSLRRLGDLRFRGTWIVVLALVAQIVVIEVVPRADPVVLSGGAPGHLRRGRCLRRHQPARSRGCGWSRSEPRATGSPSRPTAAPCRRPAVRSSGPGCTWCRGSSSTPGCCRTRGSPSSVTSSRSRPASRSPTCSRSVTC